MPFILKLKEGGLLLCDEIDPEKLMVTLQKKPGAVATPLTIFGLPI